MKRRKKKKKSMGFDDKGSLTKEIKWGNWNASGEDSLPVPSLWDWSWNADAAWTKRGNGSRLVLP